jgi:uncharacterized membrane protein YfcA
VTALFALTLLGLGAFGGFVAGLLGVGGAIVMIPLLLYVPPLVGVGKLSLKAVSGITMVQVLTASVSGMLAHRRHQALNVELALSGGLAMAAGSLTGAVGSYWIYERWLLVAFALMVTGALALVLLLADFTPGVKDKDPSRFSRERAMLTCGSVGILTGLVGAGGAFLLIPLLLVVVRVPVRIAIGTSLAIAAAAALAGLVGKLATGQVPVAAAVIVAVGAVLGAQVGASVSQRLSGAQLKVALVVTITVVAVRVWWNVFDY